MRTFDSKEKEIIKIISKSNGLKFQDLLSSKLHNKKITIDYPSKTIKIRYETKNFIPEDSEKRIIDIESAELFERIILSVILTNYFEKLGLIFLYRNEENKEIKIIGKTSILDDGQFNKIEDESIKELLLNYIDKRLIINSALNEFINNGYITNDEKRQRKSICLAWIGVAVALITSAISVYYSYQSATNKDVQIFNRDFNSKVINKDSLLSRVTEISNSNFSIIEKVDTLINNTNKKTNCNCYLNLKTDSTTKSK